MDLPPKTPPKPTEKKLLDIVRDTIRRKHYSIRTEEAYVNWIRRFILFHGKRHPKDMGAAEVEAFLTHLATEGHVATSTQNQAFSALLFLYCEVLQRELDAPVYALRARESQHIPAVLTRDEARQVIAPLSGVYQLQARLLYGSGLRLLECLRLRVKDIDFERRAITVRDAKGDVDRVTLLPESVIEPLKEHLQRVTRQHHVLTHLAVEGQVAASTQHQARATLLFLYRELLELPTDGFDVVVAASKPRRLPAAKIA